MILIVPPQTAQNTAAFDNKKFNDCVSRLFGVTHTGSNFERRVGGRTDFFGTYKGWFGRTGNVYVRSDYVSKKKLDLNPNGGAIGKTYSNSPNVNYIANDFFYDSSVADIAVMATWVHELGNSLSFIMDKTPTAKNLKIVSH